MKYNQIENIKKLQTHYEKKYKEDFKKTSKLLFYNFAPSKSAKEIKTKLKESVKDIKFTSDKIEV